MGVIIEGGGAFEFGPHAFTDAELADLRPAERARALDGLGRLRAQLVDTVPARRLERNLLVATWSLNRFGGAALLPESLFYMAQVISAFDVVSLQEISREMGALRRLISILGPEWGYLISDITEGTLGNDERFAILYYQPRVAFEHIAGEVVLPTTMLVEGRQFARKPLLASLRCGEFHFRVCTAHIHFGGGGAHARRHTLAECRTLAAFLARIAKRDAQNVILSGNFNIERKDGAAVRAFKAEGFSVPPRMVHPTDVTGTRFYDMTGLLLNDAATGVSAKIGKSGCVNPFESVFRVTDCDLYAKDIPTKRTGAPSPLNTVVAYEKLWRTRQLSDHVPLWVELKLGRTPATNAATPQE
jgi:endonuclease/exonuclease/phosphatase family metal-dependent hydrolase